MTTQDNYKGFTPFYRQGVGIMLLNHEKKVFMGRRIDANTLPDNAFTWQMPQGGIDFQETPLAAALREMKEEIGTQNVDFIYESKQWLTYDLPRSLAGVLWGGRYDGQTQKWFLFQFLGRDEEIEINTRHPEFSEWKWIELDGIESMIVPFKRLVYRQVLEEFSPIIRDIPYTIFKKE